MHDQHRHLTDDILLAGLDDELPADRRAEFAHALAACATCRARADHLQRASLEAAAAINGWHDADDLARSRARLSAALRDAARDPGRVPTAWAAWTAWLPAIGPGATWRVAMAAVAAVAVGAGLFGLIGGRWGGGSKPDVAARAALPVPSLTPGAWSAVRPDVLCAAEPETPPVPDPIRHQVLASYGMEHVPPTEYELDYLVTPELGGVPDPKNLWPQRYMVEPWNALVKDELERLLVDLVCSGRLDLRSAQVDMSSDWIAAYRKYFRTREPLRTHVERAPSLPSRTSEPRSGTATNRPDRT